MTGRAASEQAKHRDDAAGYDDDQLRAEYQRAVETVPPVHRRLRSLSTELKRRGLWERK